MVYTVGEMAKILGVPASTLRYYDKEGLLPFVERSSGGIRVFKDQDYEWLKIIECMKDIKTYIELALVGDETIHERLELFRQQKQLLQEKIVSMQQTLEVLEYKCWYYETAENAGTVNALQSIPMENVPQKYRDIRKQLSGIPKV